MNKDGRMFLLFAKEALGAAIEELENMRYAGELQEQEYLKVKDIEGRIEQQWQRLERL